MGSLPYVRQITAVSIGKLINRSYYEHYRMEKEPLTIDYMVHCSSIYTQMQKKI